MVKNYIINLLSLNLLFIYFFLRDVEMLKLSKNFLLISNCEKGCTCFLGLQIDSA